MELTREQVEHRCDTVRDMGHLMHEANELRDHDAALRLRCEEAEARCLTLSRVSQDYVDELAASKAESVSWRKVLADERAHAAARMAAMTAELLENYRSIAEREGGQRLQ